MGSGGLIDGVARGGNLLLNVGPRGLDAAIPHEQTSRLRRFGAWLRANGTAIHGARPWTRSDGATTAGATVRFTFAGADLNLIFPAGVETNRVVVKDLTLVGEGRVLADGSTVALERLGPDLALTFAAAPAGATAPVVAVAGVAAVRTESA